MANGGGGLVPLPGALLSIKLRVWEPGKPAGKWARMTVCPVLEACPYNAFLGHIINAMGENVPDWVGEARESGMLYLFSEQPCDKESKPCDVTSTRKPWPGMFWSMATGEAGCATLLQHLTATENNGSDNLWLAKACPVCVQSGTTLFVLTSLFQKGVCKKMDTAHNRRREERKIEQSTTPPPPRTPTTPFCLPQTALNTPFTCAVAKVHLLLLLITPTVSLPYLSRFPVRLRLAKRWRRCYGRGWRWGSSTCP